MKKGIIFDMDGTIWDSAKNVAISWEEEVKREAGGFRTVTTEDVQSVMGKTMVDISKILFSELGEEKALELMKRCCDAENEYLRLHGGELYPKLEETLQILSEKYPLYIVSNCQSGYIEAFLDHYGFWKYFKDIACWGDTGKPKAYTIDYLVKKNHIDKAVYVGDIQGDYDASMQAGVDFIHASYGFGTIDTEVPCIREFAELPSVAAEVLGE